MCVRKRGACPCVHSGSEARYLASLFERDALHGAYFLKESLLPPPPIHPTPTQIKNNDAGSLAHLLRESLLNLNPTQHPPPHPPNKK